MSLDLNLVLGHPVTLDHRLYCQGKVFLGGIKEGVHSKVLREVLLSSLLLQVGHQVPSITRPPVSLLSSQQNSKGFLLGLQSSTHKDLCSWLWENGQCPSRFLSVFFF